MAWFRIEAKIKTDGARGEELFYYLETLMKNHLPVEEIRTLAVSVAKEGFADTSE
ncbi:MAG: hypothetical protein WC683_15175 [bacterium]